MAMLVFSYSHNDSELRDELEIHLTALKRQGVIDTWHDRRIGAGKEFNREISENFNEADIILLLISPYFIASDYCYDVEMKRAMERHENGEARVIPVILEPCDWQKLPFGKLTATPTDGKTISKFPNKHDGFLEVTRAIRKAAEELCGPLERKKSGYRDRRYDKGEV
jgi:TIR domain